MDGYGPWFSLGAQTQAIDPPTVSPEILKALAELVRATGSVPRAGDWLSPERMQACASLIGAVAWPLAAIAAVVMFRDPILNFLSNVTDVEIGGAKFKRLQQELVEAGEEASEKPGLLTRNEQARAANVATLLGGVPSLVVREAEKLAFEYERVRASLPSGDERTRRMEVVVAKMRTIGQAAFPLRHELAAAPSPGKRLQAIATLQVMPDYEMLEWLAGRPAQETPFVSYHALIALLQAARGPQARAHRDALVAAVPLARRSGENLSSESDRKRLLEEFGKLVGSL